MRIICRHGYLSFYPRRATDIAFFQNYFECDLERVEDYYTFSFLADAKRYSLKGKKYLNLTPTATFEGEVWDVFKANEFVTDITYGTLSLKGDISMVTDLPRLNYDFLSPSPVIQPGSVLKAGQKILSYDAEFSTDTMQLRVREFSYE
jgi:hypothetical protein